MSNEAKVFNTKKGKANDNWKYWAHVDGQHFAYVKFKDSLIRESILAERKVDDRDIRHEICLIYKRPWTGFRDNTTENSNAYCSFVKKAYWEGRIDQFLIAELIPGKDAKIHEMSLEQCQDMQTKANELDAEKLRKEEQLAKLKASFAARKEANQN